MVNNNSFGGIIVKQWKGADTGGEHWASREEGKAMRQIIISVKTGSRIPMLPYATTI